MPTSRLHMKTFVVPAIAAVALLATAAISLPESANAASLKSKTPAKKRGTPAPKRAAGRVELKKPADEPKTARGSRATHNPQSRGRSHPLHGRHMSISQSRPSISRTSVSRVGAGATDAEIQSVLGPQDSPEDPFSGSTGHDEPADSDTNTAEGDIEEDLTAPVQKLALSTPETATKAQSQAADEIADETAQQSDSPVSKIVNVGSAQHSPLKPTAEDTELEDTTDGGDGEHADEYADDFFDPSGGGAASASALPDAATSSQTS